MNREWAIYDSIGDFHGPGSDTHRECRTKLDYFLMLFPDRQLNLMVRLTNKKLVKHKAPQTTRGEIIRFLGLVLLTTRHQFRERASLWEDRPPSNRWRQAPAFGRSGMSRNRFDQLWRHMTWSDQPETRPESMSHEAWRWRLVDDNVDNFNRHRAQYFRPSGRICVDESIFRWYGQGGHWINLGLPMYVAMDRKPEAGAEVQNAACGESGVMIRLRVVKTAKAEEEEEDNNRRQHLLQENDEGVLHGTAVLCDLVRTWSRSNRVVCADSYFASVPCAKKLRAMGFGFIGVVKTATKQYPMQYLSSIELQERGDRKGLVVKDEQGTPTLLAYVWMDRDRRYFIATTDSLESGRPYVRERWRQVNTEDPNAEPEKVELEIPQPLACETYYSTCAAIDRNNRTRQDDVKIERKLGTHDWSTRFNLSIFGIHVTDTWYVYKAATMTEDSVNDFVWDLAAEMIDNEMDGHSIRSATKRGREIAFGEDESETQVSPLSSGSGGAPHLTPTKKKKKKKDASGRGYVMTNHSLQGRCTDCDCTPAKQTVYECSLCNRILEGDHNTSRSKGTWVCHPHWTKRRCWERHLARVHGHTFDNSK